MHPQIPGRFHYVPRFTGYGNILPQVDAQRVCQPSSFIGGSYGGRRYSDRQIPGQMPHYNVPEFHALQNFAPNGLQQERSFIQQGRPFIQQGRPFIQQERPFIQQGRPFIQQERPFIQQGRPFIQQERPFIQQERPFIQQERPFIQQERPFIQQGRPFIQQEPPGSYFDQSNAQAYSQQRSSMFESQFESAYHLAEQQIHTHSSRPTQISESNHVKVPHPRIMEWKDNLRFWHVLKSKKRKKTGSMEISVMSYNILSQTLLEDHAYLYKRCSAEDLNWSVRGPAIIKQIKHHKSDILCLQEVEKDQWEKLIQPALESSGYKGFFMKRTGLKADGCAILYRHKKFRFIEFIPINFKKGGVLDRDNVGLILLLKPKGKYYRGCVPKICVATTHLLFNPRRGDVKLAQLMLFLAEIEKSSFIDKEETVSSGLESETEMKSKHPYCPVILCGDMNLEPRSYLYDFITQGYLRYDECPKEELSGQEEGWGRGYYTVSSNLLPKYLDINDHCQFIQQAIKRQRSEMPIALNSDMVEDNLEQVNFGGQEHEDKDNDNISVSNDSKSDTLLLDSLQNDETKNQPVPILSLENRIITQMNTGQACHKFFFQSVYPQSSRCRNMVTTYHERASCTVDYIFYSSGETIPCNKKKDKHDGERKKRKLPENSTCPQKYASSHKSRRANEESDLLSSNNEELKYARCTVTDGNENVVSTRTCLNMSESQEPSTHLEICEADGIKSEDFVKGCSKYPSRETTQNNLYDFETKGIKTEKHVSELLQTHHNVKGYFPEPDTKEEMQSCSNDKESCTPISNDKESCTPRDCREENITPVKSLELIAYWSLLSKRQMNKYPCIPNHIFPSDHICLIAKFLLH